MIKEAHMIKKDLFEKHTKLKLGKCIYNFGTSTIYYINNNPNKIIKFCSMKEYKMSDKISHSYVNKLFSLIKFFQHKKSSPVVKIHKYGKFKNNDDIYYFYVMDKLKPIKPLLMERDQLAFEIEKSINYQVVLADLPQPAKSLVRQLINCKYKYADFHGGNIMKNKKGEFKLIDLESFIPYPHEGT